MVTPDHMDFVTTRVNHETGSPCVWVRHEGCMKNKIWEDLGIKQVGQMHKKWDNVLKKCTNKKSPLAEKLRETTHKHTHTQSGWV